MIDDKQKKMIEEYAQMVARNLVLYGVDIRGKYDSAVSMSLALENAYLRGRSDGLKYAYKKTKKVGEWIPCSERLPKETDFPEQKYRILASCSDGIVRNATIEDLRDRSKKHFNGSHCEFAYLAWQPLPEPYKE